MKIKEKYKREYLLFLPLCTLPRFCLLVLLGLLSRTALCHNGSNP
jgi:hypothetical protein